MFEIYDSILSEEDKNEIELFVTKSDIGWNFLDHTVTGSPVYQEQSKNFDLSKFNEIPFFSHRIVSHETGQPCSQYFNFVEFLIKSFNANTEHDLHNVHRAQINLTMPSVIKGVPCPPHIDTKMPHFVLIYYVNDADGNTVFFDEMGNVTNQVTPKKGRFLLFSGEQYHSGIAPQQTPFRAIFNMVLS